MTSQIEIIQLLQIHLPQYDPVLQFFAFLGQPEFSLLIIPVIIWCINRHHGIRLLLLISISGAICEIIKILVHSPRPYWVSSGVQALSHYPSFGFPSGHAQNAVVFFGFIAAWLKKRWVTGLCISTILLIGLARVYQAVHYPLDIIGGMIIGVLLLILYFRCEKAIDIRIAGLSTLRQIMLAFIGSGILLVCSLLALSSLGSWEVPSTWFTLAQHQSGFPISPLIPHDTLAGAGLFFGTAAGAALFSRNPRPEQKLLVRYHILNYVIGMIILLGFWFGVKGLIQHEQYGWVIEYGRSVLAGMWVTYGAPLLFMRGLNPFFGR